GAADAKQTGAVVARRRARRAREPLGRERLRASGGSRRAGRDLYDRAVDDGRGPIARPRRDRRGARAEPGRNLGGNAMTTKRAAGGRAEKPRGGKVVGPGVAIPPRGAGLRGLRRTRPLRDLVSETRVSAEQLIMPHFVLPEKRANEPISSMPGIAQQG